MREDIQNPEKKPKGGNPSQDHTRQDNNIKLDTESLTNRITSKLGDPDLIQRLSSLPGSELTSLLLTTFDGLVKSKTPPQILKEYTNNILTNIAEVDSRKIHALEQAFYDLLKPEYEAVELSILNPLGANAVISGVSQKTAFSAVRGAEVIADITIALSMEAALRRQAFLRINSLKNEPVHLAAAQRIARLRQRPDKKGFNAHWKLVSLASACQNIKWGEKNFEVDSFYDHARVYLKLFERAERANNVRISFSDVSIMTELIERAGLNRHEILHQANHGRPFSFQDLEVSLPERVSDLSEAVEQQFQQLGLSVQFKRLSSFVDVIQKLQNEFPNIEIDYNIARTAGAGYYRNLCFHITATTDDGEELTMVDAGNPDWTQKMLGSKKETIVVSGMGSELFIRKFGFAKIQ